MSRIPISGIPTTYDSTQAGDTFALDRAGVMGKITYDDLSASFIASLNVGTVEFATIAADFARVTTNTESIFDLQTRNSVDTHERTRFYKNLTGYGFDTTNNTATARVNDYFATVGASGATTHRWNIEGVQRFLLSDNRAIISSQAIAALDIAATDATNTHEVVRLFKDTSGYGFLTADSTGTAVNTDYLATVGASGATGHSWRISGVERFAVVNEFDGVRANGVRPFSSGAGSIGSSATRYVDIFLTGGVDTSSDARLKDGIRDLNAAERRAAAKMRTVTYTLKSNGKRKIGYVAQEIIAAMESEGLNAFEYGLVSDGETYGVDINAINAFRLGSLT